MNFEIKVTPAVTKTQENKVKHQNNINPFALPSESQIETMFSTKR